jgi:hypothetical protein
LSISFEDVVEFQLLNVEVRLHRLLPTPLLCVGLGGFVEEGRTVVNLLESAVRYIAALENLMGLGAFDLSIRSVSPAFVLIGVLDAPAL